MRTWTEMTTLYICVALCVFTKASSAPQSDIISSLHTQEKTEQGENDCLGPCEDERRVKDKLKELHRLSTKKQERNTSSDFVQASSAPQSDIISSLHTQEKTEQGENDCLGPCEDERRVKDKLKELHRLTAKKQGRNTSLDGFEDKLYSSKVAKVEDIRFTEEQVDEILNVIRGRRKRKLATFSDSFQKWNTFPIKYKFNGTHSSEQINRIESAMHHWEAHTCIRFQRAAKHEIMRDTHLLFTSKYGCSSFIGKTKKMEQIVDLTSWCTDRWGTIVHEIGHVIGFWHEHQRSDRNTYVKLLDANIKLSLTTLAQLSQRGLTRNLLPYDYGSIMHYRSRIASKNGNPTIETVDPLYNNTIGQNTGLAFSDAKLANIEYCKDTCKNRLPQPCQREGYQDPNNCHQCKCPDGFSGTYCEKLQAPKGALCGRKETLASGYTYIVSPGYNSLNRRYNDRIECNWLIKAPRGQRLAFQFEGEFSIYCHKEGYDNLCFHWVEVRFKRDLTLTGARFCCDKRPTVVLRSEGEEMLILMRANFSTESSHRGFKARVHAVTQTGSPVPYRTTLPITLPKVHRISTTYSPSTSRLVVRASTRRGKSPGTKPVTPPWIFRPIKPITEPLDVAFLLDSSGSIGRANWLKILKFVKQMAFYLGLNSGSARIGVISYGNKGTLNIKLSSHTDAESFQSAVDKLKWKDQFTNLPSALAAMRLYLFTRRNGDRDDASNIGIIITDGAANKDADKLTEEARLARNGGATKIFGIAVGKEADKDELLAVTNSDRHVLSCLDFDWLNTRTAIRKITEAIIGAVRNSTPKSTKKSPTTNPNGRLQGTTSKEPFSGVSRVQKRSSLHFFIFLITYCVYVRNS